MTKALVLGATGHIGAHIVRALLDAGYSVRACYRNPAYLRVLEGLPIERMRLDLDSDNLEPALEGCGTLFFAAGYYPDYRVPPGEALAKATQMARRVFAACKRVPLERVVFTSSAATIERVPGRPANENDAIAWPADAAYPVYTQAKLAMEHEALRALRRRLPIVILNPSICIGEYDSRCFSGRLLTLYAGTRFPFYLKHQLNLVDTRDVGIAHVLAAQHGAVGERYILNGETLSMREWVALLGRVAGKPIHSMELPYGVALAASGLSEKASALFGRTSALTAGLIRQARLSQVLSAEKAKRALQWKPQPIERAVERAAKWFEKEGILKV